MSGEPDVATAAKKRTLELDAFSSLVDALRAAGPLTPERKAVLQQTATALKISADRYKAEIRRALAKPNLSGEIDETSWAMEGRRDTFLLPRKPPRATLPAPYAAYTTRLTPALVQLPRAPYRSAKTQTISPKVAANPKLVVVSSPRSQTTHTMVYAKPGGQQRQVRICPQAGAAPLAVASAKTQQVQQQAPPPPQASKMVTVPTVVRPSGPVSTPVAAVTASVSAGGGNGSASSCVGNSVKTTVPIQQQQPPTTPQQVVVNSGGHHIQQHQQAQQCKQIVITTPNNVHPQQQSSTKVVERLNIRTSATQQPFALQTVQVRPTIGTPVVTKVLHPNRTTELKVLQKPRLAQVRTTSTPVALATMTPTGVRLAPTLTGVRNGGTKTHLHSTSASADVVQASTTIKPPAKIIKSLSQWNYDDHSVMAKPAVIAPASSGSPTTITLSSPSELAAESTTTTTFVQQHQQYVHHPHVQRNQHPTQIQLTSGGSGPQMRTVQIVQMSTHAQAPTTPPRVSKPIRMVTPTQVVSGPSHGSSGNVSNHAGNNNNGGSGGSHNTSNSNNNNNNNNNGNSSSGCSSGSGSSVTSSQGGLHGAGHRQLTSQAAAAATTGATTTTTTTTSATTQQPRPRETAIACTAKGSSNVVVQSLPYQDYQGSIYKMVPEDVIMEEEVA